MGGLCGGNQTFHSDRAESVNDFEYRGGLQAVGPGRSQTTWGVFIRRAADDSI